VRQALLHAVDRKAILDNIMEGLRRAGARRAGAPGVFGYKDMQLDRSILSIAPRPRRS
jgi:ABC-type transport system substrate-binding protein